ncbi:MAG: Fe-S cluster assembly protein SufD [Lysobacterales bacterium]|jgi:Fe-S cluster assembly protein SufD
MNNLSIQLPSGDSAGPLPDWLKTLRHDGAEKFRSHGLPTRKDEAWKYTPLSALGRDEISVGAPRASAAKKTPAEPLTSAPLQVQLLDGRVSDMTGAIPGGVSVTALGEALAAAGDDLRSMLESLPAEGSAQAFTALNTALLEHGLVIRVEAGRDAGRVLLNYSSAGAASPHIFNTRVCVLLEAGARLELIEQFESAADSANTGNVVLQAKLDKGASLAHLRVQQEPDTASLITRTELSQAADSDYAYYGFDLGGGFVRHDLHSTLSGEGAAAHISGAYLVDEKRLVDNHVRVDHVAPGCISDQYFRGVAGGSGKAVFNTAVRVHEGADGTEARQSNANILLSARAEVDTKPEFEIYADDVIASHGATVGQLDEQAVFYLRSRGLSEEEARQLLISAFCRSVCDRLADRELADVIAERLLKVQPKQ